VAYSSRKDDYHHIRWSKEVMIRDHFTCQVCGRRGNLNSHHLKSYADNPNSRYDIENGVCLCVECHDTFHSIYGKGRNTEEQFAEFEQVYNLLIKTAQHEVRMEYVEKKVAESIPAIEIAERVIEDLDGYARLQ